MPPPYHHGDLPNALRSAAVDLITEKGPSGFSLREVARRAGVSHAAPAHHFGDTTGLLTDLAVQAFDHLHAAMVAALASAHDADDRLEAVGVAYVETGRDYPAHCEVVFRRDLVDTDDPAYSDSGLRTYALLHDTVRAVADQHDPDLDVDAAARLCWSAMQGLLVLHAQMTEIDRKAGVPTVDLVEQSRTFTRLLLRGFTHPATA
jgi:AcrR family transcriptional regulator